jgi:hypothetical protein
VLLKILEMRISRVVDAEELMQVGGQGEFNVREKKWGLTVSFLPL